MKNQPFLTVIVPCYNVEKYIDKCIASIVGQTYTNLEILLIDDGSSDNSGTICDAWQERDSRIRVIHKQNEGSSYARKTGIEHTTAEYVTFVDADDWIDENMYSDMMTALLSTNSDIAQCSVCEVFEDGRVVHCENEDKTGDVEIVGRIKSVLLILENKEWHSYMWNKIFRKQLFDHIIFPKGRGYGEDFISHDLFHIARQSVYVHHEYYFYFQRSHSITGSTDISEQLKNHSDFFDAWQDRHDFATQHAEYHSALPRVNQWVFRLGINLLRNILIRPQHFINDTGIMFDKISERLRSIPLTWKDRLGRGIKIELYVLKYAGAKCYRFYRMLYVKIIKMTNRLRITDNKRTCYLLSEMWEMLESH